MLRIVGSEALGSGLKNTDHRARNTKLDEHRIALDAKWRVCAIPTRALTSGLLALGCGLWA